MQGIKVLSLVRELEIPSATEQLSLHTTTDLQATTRESMHRREKIPHDSMKIPNAATKA